MNLHTKKIKKKKCKVCQTEFTPFKTTDTCCSFKCSKLYNKPIAKKSSKRKAEEIVYSKLRKRFLSKPENQNCFVNGCPNIATTIEHTRGRIGKNYLDVSTWKPCCAFCNTEFERNTELSQKYQESKFHEGKKIIK